MNVIHGAALFSFTLALSFRFGRYGGFPSSAAQHSLPLAASRHTGPDPGWLAGRRRATPPLGFKAGVA